MARQTARDVMEKDLLTIGPDTPLIDVHRLFVEDEINGAPVVDDEGNVLGIVTSLDLLRVVEEEHDTGSTEPVYFRDSLEFSGPDWMSRPNDFQDRLGGMTAADAMTPGVISVDGGATVGQVARTMHDHKVHRVLVCEGKRLVGLISTFDLLRVLMAQE